MKSLSLTKPHVIILIGIPGSGKTFFAQQFAETFNAPYIHLEQILRLSGTSATAARKLADYQLRELLKTKQSIIIEGLVETRVERTALMRTLESAGYGLLLVWVQTDPVTAQQRATKRGNGKTNHILTLDQFDRLSKRFVAPSSVEPSLVISGKHTYASQARVVLKKLSAPRIEQPTPTTTPTASRHKPELNVASVRRDITVR